MYQIKIMESKSFKLFLFTFRNYGGFHEDCTIKVAKKIIKYTSKMDKGRVTGIQEEVYLLM